LRYGLVKVHGIRLQRIEIRFAGESSDLLEIIARSRNSSEEIQDIRAAGSLESSYANYWKCVKLPFFACNMSAGSGGRDEQWLGLKLDCIDENGLPALDGYLK
jgi:hypothetical protein